ncbi:chemotaxis protein CheW [Acidisoma silvae]|uniref:Purine-binding chemotaxis protein CheW n=1 Tax=Acidisoma silvae TaxID=2802396 RepID=A0A963YR47_9PROT|nr:chemotaxis protein CheW [Acidisoma silvae]MCB8874943.1 purine-binding chemotaxis protein CheW [Acidisoma silvae]
MSKHAQDAAARQSERADQLLSVRLGDQEFALNIMDIREIRGWIASTPLPHAPDYIRGMINLRGQALAIVDLARRLGLPASVPTPASVVVVVEWEEKTLGLLVDAVSDIITVTDAMRQPTPDTGDATAPTYVESLVMIDQSIIGILSLSAVIPRPQMQLTFEDA